MQDFPSDEGRTRKIQTCQSLCMCMCPDHHHHHNIYRYHHKRTTLNPDMPVIARPSVCAPKSATDSASDQNIFPPNMSKSFPLFKSFHKICWWVFLFLRTHPACHRPVNPNSSLKKRIVSLNPPLGSGNSTFLVERGELGQSWKRSRFRTIRDSRYRTMKIEIGQSKFKQ